jgi:hypothetical protein
MELETCIRNARHLSHYIGRISSDGKEVSHLICAPSNAIKISRYTEILLVERNYHIAKELIQETEFESWCMVADIDGGIYPRKMAETFPGCYDEIDN